MQVVTQVCESLAMKLLDLESRLDAVDSSVKGMSMAMEAEGLSELLGAVGGRLDDLKDLLAVEESGHASSSGSSTLSLVDSGQEALPLEAGSETGDDGAQDDESVLETVYVDDPEYDSMPA